MGSEYYTCSVSINDVIYKNQKYEWIDRYFINNSQSMLILASWSILNNNPGFKIHKVNLYNLEEMVSERYEGLIEGIQEENNSIMLTYKNYSNKKWAFDRVLIK